MRRFSLLAAGLAVPTVAAGLVALRPTAHARPEPPAEGKPAATLPIKQVALFSSGVGSFVREAEIDGDATVELQFPARDVNDLLKSLTLRDLGQGTVDAVNYDSQAPIERALQSFALDLNDNPSLVELLGQARGERVELVAPRPDKSLETVAGEIVSLEVRQEPHGAGPPVETAVVNVLTAEGVRAVSLREVSRLRFLDPALDVELRRALRVLATAKNTQKKAVSLRFRGQGKRPVRVGYVVEAPVWKTSYRLTIGDAGKPYLQGWAMVENPSDEDWRDVRMTLVSGRPVSFKMDLYQPLYVPRPTVVEERYASLRPPVYGGPVMGGGGLAVGGGGGGLLGGMPADPEPQRNSEAARQIDAVRRRQWLARGRDGEQPQADASPPPPPAEALDLSRGIISAASAARLGDSFVYAIHGPVSLPRQKSALLPIVGQEVEGRRVSIYNPATHPKFPMLGLHFKNTSALNLMQGPVTLFDGGTYAGDARLPDLQPGEDRLLSYAIDLGTEVAVRATPSPTRIVAVTVVKGRVQTVMKQRDERQYKAANRSAVARTLLIEHPIRPAYALQGGLKPAEQTRDLYRFALELPAQGRGELTVVEESDIQRSTALGDLDPEAAKLFLSDPAPSPAVKAALREAQQWQERIATVRRATQAAGQQLAEIEKDQQRLRENVKVTPDGTAARKRYLDKFDAQEPIIEKLQAEQRRLHEQEAKLVEEYEMFVNNLTIE